MAVKLVIWGLDGTLWAGVLAAGDAVVLNEARAGLIKQLNQHGVISAICAKNDGPKARAALTTFKLWSQTVFNRIGYGPKGPAVRALLEDMRVEPAEALVVDDNPTDLAEVAFFCPGIQTADATTPECDAALAALLRDVARVKKSRLAEMRRLEKKQTERAVAGTSNEAFLRTRGIRVAVARRTDNFDFLPAIEALLRQDGPGNVVKAPLPEGGLGEALEGYYRAFDCRGLFAWDGATYLGLVGFAAVRDGTTLLHFAVARRVLDMGIAEWFLGMLLKGDQFPALDVSGVPFKPRQQGWIKWEGFTGAVRAMIVARETGKALGEATIRIIADHQSAPIARFAGLGEVAETDVFPRGFELRHGKIGGHLPPQVVYLAGCEYDQGRGPWGGWTAEIYAKAAAKFCELLAARGVRLLLVLPPEELGGFVAKWGVTQGRVVAFNAIWRKLAAGAADVAVVEIGAMAAADELVDVRHYRAPLLRRIGEAVAAWFDGVPARLNAAE